VSQPLSILRVNIVVLVAYEPIFPIIFIVYTPALVMSVELKLRVFVVEAVNVKIILSIDVYVVPPSVD
jgi:hypothetical protein